jgi:cytochrome c-type biogenesis protein CcmH
VRRLERLLLGLALAASLGASAPDDPADRLANPAEEARARALFSDVRCLVCQSQSIEDSEAPLARDLRQLIRSQVSAGRSDAEIRRFLTSRYGQFVLLAPTISAGNAILWLGPLAIVIAGLGVLAARGRRAGAEAAELDPEEERKIAALTADRAN